MLMKRSARLKLLRRIARVARAERRARPCTSPWLPNGARSGPFGKNPSEDNKTARQDGKETRPPPPLEKAGAPRASGFTESSRK